MAKTFNEFFVSIVKNLGINENFLNTSSSETRNSAFIIAKFENHPSIVTIRNRFDENSIFSFKEIEKVDIPTKIILEFDDLFATFISKILTYVWIKANFQKVLKLLKLLQFIRKQTRSRKTTTDRVAFCLIFQKYLRELCIINWIIFL